MALTQLDGMPGQLPSGEAEQVMTTVDDRFDGYVDYFAFDDEKIFWLPDGKQWISFKPLTEGGRARYEAVTSRDIKFNRRTDDASLKMDAASDRHALLAASVTGWNLVRRTAKGFEPVAFSKGSPGSTFEQWLDKTNPKIINQLVDDVRKANPWLTEEMTVEMIDEEIKRLEALREETLERDAAKKSS